LYLYTQLLPTILKNQIMQKINQLTFKAFWLLMIVFSVAACKKEETTPTVTTPPTPPVASFGFPNTGLNAPCDVVFTNITTGESVTYQWDFGDGGASAEKTPTHRYNTVGTYTVKLTASNTGGSSSATKLITIGAQTAPIANFSFPNTPNIAGTAVVFTNTTIGSSCTYLWAFGDGTNSTEANPSHTFTNAGTYYVRMTATNNGGTNFVEKTVEIQAAPIVYTQFRVTGFQIVQTPVTLNSFYATATDNLNNALGTSSSGYLSPGTIPTYYEFQSSSYTTDISQNTFLNLKSYATTSFAKSISFKAIDSRPVSNTSPANSSTPIINTTDGWGVRVFLEWYP
jgi:PKD repeat protein